VATGDELLALRRDLEQLRAEGRAIRAEVQHQYTVIRVDGDEAQVLDRFRDFSMIWFPFMVAISLFDDFYRDVVGQDSALLRYEIKKPDSAHDSGLNGVATS
jgi:hypothetical protein